MQKTIETIDGEEWAIITAPNGSTIRHLVRPALAPSPEPLTKLEFYDRFTDDELATIFTAAKTVVQVEIFVEKIKAATEIRLDDPRLIFGLQAMETMTYLAEGRADEILTY